MFVRGGTSKGVFFHARHLPPVRTARDAILLEVLGSPDPYQRQLNGMGGGLSSLSKVAIIARSPRNDVDLKYTFAQIAVDRPIADYAGACGNLSAAVGPFAVDEGLLRVADGETVVRVLTTNNNRIFHARFEVRDGRTVERGSFRVPGVAGSGSRGGLDYLDPVGASGLLPSAKTVDDLDIDEAGVIPVSLVDATNPVVFVDAGSLGKTGLESPRDLEADRRFMRLMEKIRRHATVNAGLAAQPGDVPLSNPKVAIVGEANGYLTISGEKIEAEDYDLAIRIVSMERVHLAVTGTGGMCVAAASQVAGTLPNRLARSVDKAHDIRIGTPSGVLPLAASVECNSDGVWHVEATTMYRTQRRLMEGCVRLCR